MRLTPGPAPAIVGLLAVILTTSLLSSAVHASPAPNGPIAFESDRDGNREIYRVTAGSEAVQRLTENAGEDRDPEFSPDGRTIVFARGPNLWRMDADGTDLVQLTTGSTTHHDPSWSPDGSRIAYTKLLDVWVMNADGSGQTNLTAHADADEAPTWSPDGTKIAFHSNRDGDFDIFVMLATGGSASRLTNSTAQDSWPAWSPDGTKIAFVTNRHGDFEIYTTTPDGATKVRVTAGNVGAQSLAWSPDGTQLVFSASGGSESIHRIDADGTDQTAVLPVPAAGWAQHVTWGRCPPHGFTDVPPWAAAAAGWVSCHTYMTGYFDGSFRPDANITRAQVARLLYRVAGSPDVSHLTFHPFTDVAPWATDAITWMFHNGYATGHLDLTFRPDQPITRAQVTRMLHRIAGSPAGAAHGFPDVPNWVDAAVDWIADPVHVPPYATGYPDGTYRPDNHITRAQTARMTCRLNTTGVC